LDTPILLETSAFKSTSIEDLEKYNLKGLKIMISPYTFLELLCHLDEEWNRNKGQICKCSRVKILDDPRAIFETDLHYRVERLNNRVPNDQLFPEIIECLRKSNSINDFYNSDFIDSLGNKRLIKECTKRAQETLNEEAEKYSNFVKKIYSCFIQEKYSMDSDKDCHNVIMELVEGAVICAENNSNQTKNIRSQVINTYYLYFAYIFERTKQLMNDDRTQPQRNDYEDGLICLHLHLDIPLKFVTKDKGLSKVLINSLKRLQRIGWDSTQHPRIVYG
jgi:hypothetical protein